MKKLILFACITILYTHAFSQTLPTGFSLTDVSSGSTWTAPVGAAFSKDGQRLFVWEKDGRVYVCNRQGTNYVKQSQAVLDISGEVGGWRDFGLLGFALDPNFESNGYIYGLYVVDRHHLMTGGLTANGYNAATNEYFNATIGRVTRYTTAMSGSNLVANTASRKVLLGESKSTGIPILHESHGTGSLAFAADGTLLITCGDGASYNIEDGGSISHTYYAQALTDGIIRPQENVGAFRSQMLNSHNGKLLRINPETGDGVSSNPFYDASAPRSPKSRVWALGFRNPFRMSVKPGTGSTNPAAGDIGEILVGEVGWSTWEEQNVVTTPGTNFGWPLYEGQTVQPAYMALETQNGDEPNPFGSCSGRPNFRFKDLLRQDNAAKNKSVYNPCNASQLIGTGNRYIHNRPSLDWQHGQNVARVGKFDVAGNATNPTIGTPESQVVGSPFAGNCSAGGIWYTGAGNTFPADYKNTFIAADYGGTWIRRFSMDFTDVVTRVDNFVSGVGAVVCLVENPIDGSIVCVNVGSSTVKKISFGGNIPPVAKITADNYYSPSTSLTVNFSGTGSTDQDGSIASYSWNFGDPGSTGNTSTSPTPSHQFTTTTGAKKFIVTLTVTDNGGIVSAVQQFIVSVNNTPPNVNITSPIKNSFYTVGRPDTLYTCTATVSDAQHTASQLTYEWQTFLRHNNHEHAEAIDNNVNTTTNISRIGCTDEYYWLIKLKVTDAAGLSTSDSAKIFPDCGGGVDNTPPTVSNVSPVNGATGVGTSTTVTATFNEAINASTVTSSTVQLRNSANTLIAATLSTAGTQVILTPSAALATSTLYTVTITGGASGVKDLAGNALANNYSWSFTTGTTASQPVTIQTASAKTGTAATVHTLAGVPAGALLVLTTTADVVVSDCAVSSSPSLTWTKRSDAGATSSDNAEIWTAVYAGGGSITVTSNWGAESQASVCYVVLNAEATLGGAAATGVSQAAPSVTITTTKDNSIIFGCTADWKAINGATRTLRDAATERLYFKDGNYTTYYYTKAATSIAAYTEGVSLPTGQQASTALLEIRGTGIVAPDNTPPTVSSVTPVTGATGVPVSTTPSAIFSEAMNAATINSSTFELRNASNTLIAATVSYNAGTRTATLTPSAALANSSVYTAKIISGTAGVKDAAGNALASDYSWSFTTEVGDIIPPTVSSVTPINGATGISVSTTPSAIFSEAMNAATINSSTIELRNASNTLTGTIVSYNAATRTVTLTPTAALTISTTYTINIIGGTLGVKDLAGNALVNNYSWSFTTGSSTAPPAVTIQSVTTKTGTAATVHSLTGVPAGALLVLATTADAVVSDCSVSSSPALTWTKRADAGAASSDNAEIWTALYSAGGSITVTSNWGGEESQASVCYVVLNAEAVLAGASAVATLQAAPSVTITTTRDNSIIFGCTADWKAINGATRTLRDAATERLYFKDGNYTTYYYTKAATSIAAYTEGVSLPTGQQASTALLEIRGAGAVSARSANPVVINARSRIQNHSLGQNYPNPFDKGTKIPFTLSGAEKVNLVLFDINGRVVKVLVNASKDAGAYTVNFNAGSLAKGIYYYRIQAGDFNAVKKLIIW
ncbi:MAG: Ig-like domain-containing protein [Chitinophagaceae bacterium]